MLALLPLVALRPAPELRGEDTAQVRVKERDLLQQFLEIGAGKACGLDLGYRPDVGGAVLVGEDGAFADDVADAEFGEVEDLAGPVQEFHPDPAGEDHVQFGGRLVPRQDDLPGAELLQLKPLHDALQVVTVHAPEKANARNCLAGDCRHRFSMKRQFLVPLPGAGSGAASKRLAGTCLRGSDGSVKVVGDQKGIPHLWLPVGIHYRHQLRRRARMRRRAPCSAPRGPFSEP